MLITYEGREVDVQVKGESSDDVSIAHAVYTDTQEQVEDDDVYVIEQRYSDELYNEWFDNQVGRAEAFFEGDR